MDKFIVNGNLSDNCFAKLNRITSRLADFVPWILFIKCRTNFSLASYETYIHKLHCRSDGTTENV